MFTGLIQEVGKISQVTKLRSGINLSIYSQKLIDQINIDDSVSINGCCQTVVSISDNSFSVNVVESTVQKTNLKYLSVGEQVNMELALLATSRLGGHIVQGHVNCTSKVVGIKKVDNFYRVRINYTNNNYQTMIIPEGSITVNGVSLTISNVYDDVNEFDVYVIPHTWEFTTLKFLKIHSQVNIEFDVVAQYINRVLCKRKSSFSDTDRKLITFLNGN